MEELKMNGFTGMSSGEMMEVDGGVCSPIGCIPPIIPPILKPLPLPKPKPILV